MTTAKRLSITSRNPLAVHKVKRCLFGKPDKESTKKFLETQLNSLRREQCLKWNYDFDNDCPLSQSPQFQNHLPTVLQNSRPLHLQASSHFNPGFNTSSPITFQPQNSISDEVQWTFDRKTNQFIGAMGMDLPNSQKFENHDFEDDLSDLVMPPVLKSPSYQPIQTITPKTYTSQEPENSIFENINCSKYFKGKKSKVLQESKSSKINNKSNILTNRRSSRHQTPKKQQNLMTTPTRTSPRRNRSISPNENLTPQSQNDLRQTQITQHYHYASRSGKNLNRSVKLDSPVLSKIVTSSQVVRRSPRLLDQSRRARV